MEIIHEWFPLSDPIPSEVSRAAPAGGVSASAGDAANVLLFFPDARVIDMDVEDLIKHVLASSYAIDDAKLGHIPLIVVKTYAGTPTITINRKAKVSADAWAKAKSDIKIGVKASADSDNMILYKGSEEVVLLLRLPRFILIRMN